MSLQDKKGLADIGKGCISGQCANNSAGFWYVCCFFLQNLL